MDALQFLDQLRFATPVSSELWILWVNDVEARISQYIDIALWNFSHRFRHNQTGGHVISNRCGLNRTRQSDGIKHSVTSFFV